MIKITLGKIAATSLVCAVAIATTPAAAQSRRSQAMVAPQDMGPPPAQSLGGPVRLGSYCWVSHDSSRGFGYWRACDAQGYDAFASASKQPPQSTPIPDVDPYASAREADSNLSPGGGDGGGGGGGGGGGAGPL